MRDQRDDQGYKAIVDPEASSGVSERSYAVEVRAHSHGGHPVGHVVERHGPFASVQEAGDFLVTQRVTGDQFQVIVSLTPPPFHAIDTLARCQRQAQTIRGLQDDLRETKAELETMREIACRAIRAGGGFIEEGDKLKAENERLQYAIRELSQRLDRAKADASAQWTRLQNVLHATVAGLDENAEENDR